MQTKLCNWLLEGGSKYRTIFRPPGPVGKGIGYTSVKIKSLSLLKIH